jgi:hypothetical protein
VGEIIRQRTYTGTRMVEINGGTGSIEHRVPAVVDPALRQRPLAARGKQALRRRAGPSQLPPLGTHRVPALRSGIREKFRARLRQALALLRLQEAEGQLR